jgi:XTP/dITP diphosphohydrolase
MTRRLTRGDRLVVATHNPGKLYEIGALLAPFGLDLVSAGDLGLPVPEETGETFAQNARLKAHAAARAAGAPALADDSGLEVEALGGQPGVHTADWAGEPRDWMVAMTRVETALAAARARAPDRRRARFVSTLVLAFPDGSDEIFTGVAAGKLIWPPIGDAGFGYDPMFVPDGHMRTFAEMSGREKHGIDWERGTGLSHRARAFLAFAAAMLPERGK